ncbi:adenylate cyclase [Legionella norrlandica]|uniref:Adenylate cyclase n=1 Tax=Legionella norrlandica TaxID=1498499 RepID=A0A0A2SQW2_9GAMM|nr:adenylate/guanylate cyclase domain-containing protein [Legionella norrlandica]KGP63500.1 adenylate cyclase [Legionella norrlandica]
MTNSFKISIRVSIITLFMLLLSLVGFTIIGINYLAFNKVLNSSAKSLIDKTTLLVKERFLVYLNPLNRDLIEIKNTIDRGIINPENTEQFDKFLFEAIRYDPEIFMVYYGTSDGDFIGVDRENKRVIGLTHVINSKQPPVNIRYELDTQGKIVKKKLLTRHYDPRVRPWYQQAVREGEPIWTDVYTFYVFDKSDFLVPGVTAAAPIYDKNKNLKGVIALDLTVDGLQQFISNLEVTKNTMIFVVNNKSSIIAFRSPQNHEDIRGKKLSPEWIKKLNIPLEKIDFHDFQTQPRIKSYRFKDKNYFLSYQPVLNRRGVEPWYIIIIVPENDVTEPLKNLSMRYILLTILVLFIGTILVRIVSQRISNPIIQLTEEAKEITLLNLKPRPLLKTMIKEISYMDKTLSTLRSSLTSFQRYVPSSLVKKLMRTGKIAKVGGHNQIITILFSDIKDFTTIAESTPPQKLMTYLSEYFQSMTETVIQHDGTLDKYIGDAIMALWNAPSKDAKHAFHACETARIMLERLKKLNQKHRSQEFPEFNIRIGIHTGDAIVGNMGSEDRLSYSALGDSVNLASRLESINKNYHTQIIVSHTTFTQVSGKFPFRLLDEVAVKGKQESIAIYELITAQNLEDLEQHKEEFKEAFSLYQKGCWEKSINAFAALTPAYPGDKLAAVYIKRCQELANTSPANWDGIWRERSENHPKTGII